MFKALPILFLILSLRGIETLSQMPCKMELFELDNGNFIIGKILSKNEFEDIKDVISTEFSQSLNLPQNFSIFKSANLGYILTFNDNYVLFDNLTEIKLVTENGYFLKNMTREVMLNKNPYENSLPQHTQILITQLLQELGIPENASFDKNLLSKVENKIFEVDKPVFFYRKYFTHVIALIGEVLRSNKKTIRWSMELAKDNKTWNPYLVNETAKSHFFLDLYEMIFVDNEVLNPLTEIYESATYELK